MCDYKAQSYSTNIQCAKKYFFEIVPSFQLNSLQYNIITWLVESTTNFILDCTYQNAFWIRVMKLAFQKINSIVPNAIVIVNSLISKHVPPLNGNIEPKLERPTKIVKPLTFPEIQLKGPSNLYVFKPSLHSHFYSIMVKCCLKGR